MCKCYVITAQVRFVQCIENDDDAGEAQLRAKQALEILPAVCVQELKAVPFGK